MTNSYGVTIQQYTFHMELFNLFVALTSECAEEILWCCHSN